jgi:hypothetical protein
MTRIGRILTSLTTAVLLFASPAHAQWVDKIVKARIPFEFTVGNKTFPAGSYSLVRTPPGFVILRDSRAHPVAVAITRSVQGYTAPAAPKLDFYVVDGRHVLGRVWQEDELYGDELFRPKDERSKLAKHKAEPAQLVAAGTQP